MTRTVLSVLISSHLVKNKCDTDNGEICCRDTCVNKLTESYNCGCCSNKVRLVLFSYVCVDDSRSNSLIYCTLAKKKKKKCRRDEVCCSGKCVNILKNRYNCGSCGNSVSFC